MFDAKTRFKVDIVIENEIIIRNVPVAKIFLDSSGNNEADKTIRPAVVSKELVKRIVERVERT